MIRRVDTRSAAVVEYFNFFNPKDNDQSDTNWITDTVNLNKNDILSKKLIPSVGAN